MSRKTELEKALAFKDIGGSEAWKNGRKFENTHLTPLHAALIEAVKALELYASVTDGAIGHQTAKLALAKLDKVLEEK